MDKSEEAVFKKNAALLKSEMKSQMKGKIKMDCNKILTDRMKDAENALQKGRNEQAEFDAALISVVLGLCEKSPPANGSEPPRTVANGNAPDYFGMAVEELHGAEKYFALYQETGDKRFLSMSKQELGHNAALTEMLREHGNAKDAATLDGKRQQLEKIVR